jgi:hypothetical protein
MVQRKYKIIKSFLSPIFVYNKKNVFTQNNKFTQAFVEKFSRDLAAEVKSLGVTVQTVHPGYVATNMASHMKPSLLSPDPNTFAAATLRTLGLEQRTAGYWTHKIQVHTRFRTHSYKNLSIFLFTLIDSCISRTLPISSYLARCWNVGYSSTWKN